MHKLRRDLKKAFRCNARLEEWYRQEATRVPVYRQQSRVLADLLGPAREKGSVLVAMYPDPKPDARNPNNVWPPGGLPKDLVPEWPYLFKIPTDRDSKLKGSKAKETGGRDNHTDKEAFYMVQSLGPFVKNQRIYPYDCTLPCVFVEKRKAFFIPTRGCKANSEVRIEDNNLQAVAHAAAMALHTLDLLTGEYLTVEGEQQAQEARAIEGPTTDYGPYVYDAKILICADSVGCPLEPKLSEICG
ncbi:hypothetical protein RvY_11122 [Ramazzottius varieornatus]|uniref:Uncharacterized protein n=1 Tax=Ramazzottius varieornatus TaxID=947166 RepID=A0A1D1VF29_RAMVA|nr:hypothetical protein RvY_11122 [Ramazzottius varieornatus]